MKKDVKSYEIKSAGKKGDGVFATREISKGELILIRDYSKLKKYKSGDKALTKSNHCDYVGRAIMLLIILHTVILIILVSQILKL